jgi:hypothetical protein
MNDIYTCPKCGAESIRVEEKYPPVFQTCIECESRKNRKSYYVIYEGLEEREILTAYGTRNDVQKQLDRLAWCFERVKAVPVSQEEYEIVRERLT